MLTGRLLGGVSAMSSPSITISPAVGVSRPASIRSSVVLPQPDGPSSAKNSLRWMSSETLSTADHVAEHLGDIADGDDRVVMVLTEVMSSPNAADAWR